MIPEIEPELQVAFEVVAHYCFPVGTVTAPVCACVCVCLSVSMSVYRSVCQYIPPRLLHSCTETH